MKKPPAPCKEAGWVVQREGETSRCQLDDACQICYSLGPRCGVEQWQLVGLITRRSQVQVLPPLLNGKPWLMELRFFVGTTLNARFSSPGSSTLSGIEAVPDGGFNSCFSTHVC